MIGSDQPFFSGTVGHGTKTETGGTNGTIFLYFSTRSRRRIRSPLEDLVDPRPGSPSGEWFVHETHAGLGCIVTQCGIVDVSW
jgi:hypothetical protein